MIVLSSYESGLVRDALHGHADMLTRETRRRGMAGPALASTRARIRRDVVAARDLARRLAEAERKDQA